MTDYGELCRNLNAVTENVSYKVSNLANAAALLWHALDRINWAGFYIVEGGSLLLGPFQGKIACTKIAFGRGVCGTAAAKNETQLVPNVHLFPGHIACDSASSSEIVIPLRKAGTVWGVLDIDSPETNRFSEEDRRGLEEFAKILEKVL